MASIRCLVTGGSGFVGAYIIKALSERYPSWKIISLDLRLPKEGLFSTLTNVKLATADITDPDSIDKAVSTAKPDVIIHTAGIVPDIYERYTRRIEKKVFSVNIEGTKNVITAAQKAGARALVYTSSCCAVIDDLRFDYKNVDESWPTSFTSSVYGESKAHAELLVIAANSRSLRTCVLRPSVLTGPGDPNFLPSLHSCIAKGDTPYILGPALNLWDVTDVRNVAHAHVLAATNLLGMPASVSTKAGARTMPIEECGLEIPSAAGQIFFIQNNEPISMRDFCLAIWAEFGHIPPWEVRVPIWAAWAVGVVCEYLSQLSGSTVTLSSGSIRDACATRYANGEKAERILGYQNVVGLEQSIKESCEDLKRRFAVGGEKL